MKINNSRPKLIACDYDGTLSANFGPMTERTKKALWLAHKHNCILTLITGRSDSVLPIGIEELPFDFFITGNGARVQDRKSGHYLSIISMKKETALQVLNSLKGRSIKSIHMNLDGKSYLNIRTIFSSHSDLPQSIRQIITLLVYRLKHSHFSFNLMKLAKTTEEPIEKINVYFKTQEDCQAALNVIQALPVEVFTTHGTDLEITAKGVTKGNALVSLSEYLNIPTDSFLAIGDSGNDLSMIGKAGCFLAPQNAIPEVLRKATKVIPSVTDDGVALVLEELFGCVEVEVPVLSNTASHPEGN